MNKWVLSAFVLVIGFITYFLVIHDKQVPVAMLIESDEEISSISMDIRDYEYSANEESIAEHPDEIEKFIGYIENLEANELSSKDTRELNRKMEPYRKEGKSLNAFMHHPKSPENQFNGFIFEIAKDGTGMIVPIKDGIGRVAYRIEDGTETTYNQLYSFYQSHYKEVDLAGDNTASLKERPSDNEIEKRLGELREEVKKAFDN